jgi:hypothetical protein
LLAGYIGESELAVAVWDENEDEAWEGEQTVGMAYVVAG